MSWEDFERVQITKEERNVFSEVNPAGNGLL